MNGSVLLVDDDRALCETLAAGLGKRGCAVQWRLSVAEAAAVFEVEPFDAVVTDLNMRQQSGIDLCAHVVGCRPDVPVIVVTGFGSLETAVQAIRAGAYDFISKPVSLDVLAIAVERAIRHKQLRDEVKRLRDEVRAPGRPAELLGDSEAMRRVYDLVDRVADAEVSVLVTGESGTGKEVVARALHARSRRARAPFVAVNCAAMPEPLLESELFGHVRGAFTDARESRPGLFLQASGGTVFLDEIGDMPLALQPKLLRVLQERRVRPVGGTQETPVDVRIVVATNRDLEEAIEERRFREDLFFRVNVVQVPLPPLRARGGDVLLLAQHFTARFAARAGKNVVGISPQAAERMIAYAWPGNVRELQNCIERAVALTLYDHVAVVDLPEKIRDYRRSHVLVTSDDPSELVPMEEVERRYIQRVLEAVQGNKTAAARILGYDRKRLYRKLEKLGRENENEDGKT
ncbi:MAG TPA: sigma-54 dependent transcriptional regulator [Polyangiaceae bacterium]